MTRTARNWRTAASAAALVLLLAPAALSAGAAAAAPGAPVEVGRQGQIEAGSGTGVVKIEVLPELGGSGSPKPIDPDLVKNPWPKPPAETDDEAAPDTTAPPTPPPPTTPAAGETPHVDAGSAARPVPEQRAASLAATVDLISNGAPAAATPPVEPTGYVAADLPPGADIALVAAGVLLVAAGIGALVWMALRRPDVGVVA